MTCNVFPVGYSVYDIVSGAKEVIARASQKVCQLTLILIKCIHFGAEMVDVEMTS